MAKKTNPGTKAAEQAVENIVPVDIDLETTEEKMFPPQEVAPAPTGVAPGEEEDPILRKRRLREQLLAQLAALDAEGSKAPEEMPTDVMPEEEDPEERKRKLRAQILAQLESLGPEEEEEKQPVEAPPMPAAPGEEDPDLRRRRLREQLLAQLAALDAEEGKMVEVDGDMRFRLEQLRGPLPATAEKMVEVDGDMRFRVEELRAKRLANIGIKQEEIEGLAKDGYMCAVSRKVLSGSTEPCEFCRGGCMREGGLPGLLDIEAIAEDHYKGVVVNSGYAAADNIFLVDLKTAEGDLIEAIYTGEGRPAGWVLLDATLDETSEKSLQQPRKVISMEEAQEIACKAVDGVALGVAAAIFEGFDVYAVEIEGTDGKSYDAYVALDGTLVGYDEYPVETSTTAIDEVATRALVAELDLKRAYPRNIRTKFAAEGIAMPDGNFPIADEDDLENAILAVDRAPDSAAAKAHTIKRAVELGLSNLLPGSWLETVQEKDTGLYDKNRQLTAYEREEYAKQGWALPDGTFPIANKGDLQGAIDAVSEAKDVAAAKAHVRKRARDLGLEDLLGPDFDSEVKRDVSAEDREKYAKQGLALPDGSFPIANEGDLRAAIHAVGRAKDIDKAKAHIRKRARALGLESLLGPGFDARKKDDELLASIMEFELLEEELGLNDN